MMRPDSDMSEQCRNCKHIIRPSIDLVCDAFPEEIPDEIITDGFDHTKPFPGDNGIRFEKNK